MGYIGRFAPSPTGALHAGSLVAALASYLDARAHGGQWLLRMEDVDEARTVPGSAESIMHDLRVLGLQWDGEVWWQSRRTAAYAAARDRLKDHVFPCACTRREIAEAASRTGSDGAPVYPGTCRHGLPAGREARALRLRVPEPDDPAERISFEDRWLGPQVQDLAREVGDFVLHRADGYWAYQLAVVVDDAEQGVTHVVRGADLLDSTGRQIYLQKLLAYPTPAYLHVPLVNNAKGEKLSKQTGASALDLREPVRALRTAAEFLGLRVGDAKRPEAFLRLAMREWENRERGNGSPQSGTSLG